LQHRDKREGDSFIHDEAEKQVIEKNRIYASLHSGFILIFILSGAINFWRMLTDWLAERPVFVFFLKN